MSIVTYDDPAQGVHCFVTNTHQHLKDLLTVLLVATSFPTWGRVVLRRIMTSTGPLNRRTLFPLFRVRLPLDRSLAAERETGSSRQMRKG